jgi:hypothetical protein
MSGSAIAAWPEESEPMLAIEISGAEIVLSRSGLETFNACHNAKTATWNCEVTEVTRRYRGWPAMSLG